MLTYEEIISFDLKPVALLFLSTLCALLLRRVEVVLHYFALDINSTMTEICINHPKFDAGRNEVRHGPADHRIELS